MAFLDLSNQDPSHVPVVGVYVRTADPVLDMAHLGLDSGLIADPDHFFNYGRFGSVSYRGGRGSNQTSINLNIVASMIDVRVCSNGFYLNRGAPASAETVGNDFEFALCDSCAAGKSCATSGSLLIGGCAFCASMSSLRDQIHNSADKQLFDESMESYMAFCKS